MAGALLKAWFWDEQLLVAEWVDMPRVIGDGLRSLRQLISAQLSPTDPWPSGLDALAGIQGLSLDGVLPKGQHALADYRYMSPLNPAAKRDHDMREHLRGGPIEAQLLHAGQCVWQAIPEAKRQGTAFTLDGVVDTQGQIWFLEANCNPQLHPGFYAGMLQRLFDPGAARD